MVDPSLRLSLVIPIRDEAENIAPLLDELAAVLPTLGPCEVLLVDDASRDPGRARVADWRRSHEAPWLRILGLREPAGQSAALAAGVERARASLIGAMDGDLQNDPRDLAPMLAILADPDVDGVTGVRAARRDGWVRRMSSRIGNAVRDVITGDRVADSACGLKLFRREAWAAVPRFRGMHRFMPTLVRQAGGRVVEVPVHHRPRRAGRTKYGIRNRALRGLADCLAVRWYRSRSLCYRVEERSR